MHVRPAALQPLITATTDDGRAMVWGRDIGRALQAGSLVVWGHGTVGWAPECAPSVQLQNTMLINDNDVNLAVLEGAGHYDVSTAGQPLIQARLKQLFDIA
ncbi:hypothetical protein AB0K20_29535 [Micromonospora matsumotoense]|uniref:hypothetical protein n=1 Tax=Micromonospora matsumotoense TaxID=121616 RepID=UPI003417B583